MQDGLVQRLQGGAIFVFNQLTFQEVVVETGGTSAERNTGGVQMNIVPRGRRQHVLRQLQHVPSPLRTCRRTISPTSCARAAWHSRPRSRSTTTRAAPSAGRIVRDKLWFFNAYRFGANQQYQQGNYFNKLQNQRVGIDPVWRVTFYEPDLEPAGLHRRFLPRLQPAPDVAGRGEAQDRRVLSGAAELQLFLAAAGAGMQQSIQGRPRRSAPTTTRSTICRSSAGPTRPPTASCSRPGRRRTCSTTTRCGRTRAWGRTRSAITELSTNFRYGSRALGLTHAQGYRVQHNRQYRQRVSVSYITGSHAFKTGVDVSQYPEGSPGGANDWNQINGARSYTFRDRIPQRSRSGPCRSKGCCRTRDIGAYVQDQWTIRKLTLNLGVRFTNFNGGAPATQMPAGLWVPARSSRRRRTRRTGPMSAAAWRRVRPVRQRQDGAQGVAGPVHTLSDCCRRYPGEQSGEQHDTDVERRQRQLRARLRPSQPGGARASAGPGQTCTFGQVRAGNTRRAADALGGFNRQDYNWQGVSVAAARAPPQRRTERRLFPHLVRRLPGHRQPGADAGGLRSFLRHRAERQPAARRRRQSDLRAVRRQAGGVWPRRQSGDTGDALWRAERGLQRLRSRRWTPGSQAARRFGGGVGVGRTVTDTCEFNDLPQLLPNHTSAEVAVHGRPDAERRRSSVTSAGRGPPRRASSCLRSSRCRGSSR